MKGPSELFGENVLSLAELRHLLPRPMYECFLDQLKGLQPISKPTADAIAHAAKQWALGRGATHFTHWFQPLTNATAEKHDSFLTLHYAECVGASLVTQPLDSFSGSQLVQAEPDASSFPHGGSRTTFEARGYTIWDTASPMFVRKGPQGTKVLYIPSVFISYNGQALDEKTVLLRSNDVLSRAAVKLLRLLGKESVKRVLVTLGTEQEFFLIDKTHYNQRLDLKITGRTLLGARPPRHQQLEDHYFGSIPRRVLECIGDAEEELIALGVPIKTRHNEVAPQQFEMAPIFEEASVAVDHNLLTMEVLGGAADRHGLRVLFHEKPFAGINGSGKHCNWSMMTDEGENVLEPTSNPEDNVIFLATLTAIIVGVHKHAGLLRASIASASNQWRLGANEAPPSIMSIFLGAHINAVLDAIANDGSETEDGKLKEKATMKTTTPQVKTIGLGAKRLDLKIKTLPEFMRDLTDRNRTSPFAFTGNKFEFRAVGSKQSPSFPVAMVNACVASGLLELTEAIEQIPASSRDAVSVKRALRPFLERSRSIRFEGDGYSQAWREEAARRGLLHCPTEPDAFAQLHEAGNVALLSDVLDIATREELEVRWHILNEMFVKDMVIEARTLTLMVQQLILPNVFSYRKDLVAVAVASPDAASASNPEKVLFSKLTELVNPLMLALEQLNAAIALVEAITGDLDQAAREASRSVGPAMERLRAHADALETLLPRALYPIPTYNDILLSDD